MKKTIFWLSWFQTTQDFRPLSYPPNEGVLGWWCTGRQLGMVAYTLVALVIADNEELAKNIIKTDWPEAEEWRFCESRTDCQLSDRFLVEDWMRERIEKVEHGPLA